jgi:hypothetical protein
MWQTLSRTYATPLLLEPGPSRSLRVWLILVHVVAIMILPFMSLSVWVGLIILLLMLLSLWRAIRMHITSRHPDSVRAVQWREARSCQLYLSSGRDIEARLMPQVFMLPWLVIMHFRSGRGRVHHLVLLPDMLEPEVFRRLRVRLMIELNQAVD